MGKILQSVRSILVVTEKNIRIYYSKPPVIIFGLLFPFFSSNCKHHDTGRCYCRNDFGIGLNAILVTVGIFALGYSVNILILILGIIISAFVFSCLGVFLASPSSKNPSNIMMLSSIIRFPLIFISGIFVPLEQLPLAGKILSYFSPITYLVDIFNYSLKGAHNINLGIDFLALIAFGAVFLVFANIFHKKNLLKGL